MSVSMTWAKEQPFRLDEGVEQHKRILIADGLGGCWVGAGAEAWQERGLPHAWACVWLSVLGACAWWPMAEL